MPLSDHLTLEQIQTLLDIAYASVFEDIPYERKRAIEDQIKIMPLNEAYYIHDLIHQKLKAKLDYLEMMKQEKMQEMTRN